MKALFFTDPHLRNYGSFPPFNRVEENGLTRELNNILAGFQFVAEKIDELRPQLVVLPGDIFHSPETIQVEALFASAQGLRLVRDACQRAGARFILFPGNHDTNNENLKITAVDNLAAWAEVHLEDNIIKVNHGGKTYKMGLLQYSSDVTKVVTTLRAFEKTCDFITTHMDFHNAMYDNGHRSESQIPSQYAVPIFAGDIHTASHVGSVYFIGSLVQNRFSRSDTDYVGGILVYDCETKEITRYPNKYSTHYVKIEAPEDLDNLSKDFNLVLQVKCELPDLKVLDGYEYVYIPVKSSRNSANANPTYRANTGTPFSMLKRFVSEHNPDVIDALDAVLNEGSA